MNINKKTAKKKIILLSKIQHVSKNKMQLTFRYNCSYCIEHPLFKCLVTNNIQTYSISLFFHIEITKKKKRMNIQDVDMKLYFRRKRTPPPSVILLRVLNKNDHHYRNALTNNYRSHQQTKRHPPHMVGLHVNNLDVHDTSTSSFGWQRHSEKVSQIIPAPDIVYRNTYLEGKKQEKSNTNNKHYSSSSPPLKLNNSFANSSSESSTSSPSQINPYQHRTIYDYIRQSIRQIEQQRNLKQQNLSFRVPRPQNEDSTFRRVLGEKRSSARTSLSRSNSISTTTTTSQTKSTLFNNHLKSPQTFVNYINYSRVFHSTTPNQSYEQEQLPRSVLSQN